MGEPNTTKGIWKGVIEDCRAEYSEWASDFRSLDSKAQGNVGIAGIFIAAEFAFIDKHSFAETAANVILLVVLMALTIAVVLSVWALLVREVATRPHADEIARVAADFSSVPGDKEEPSEKSVDEFHREIVDVWIERNKGLEQSNGDKAEKLRVAQYCLMAAIALIFVLCLSAIISPAKGSASEEMLQTRLRKGGPTRLHVLRATCCCAHDTCPLENWEKEGQEGSEKNVKEEGYKKKSGKEKGSEETVKNVAPAPDESPDVDEDEQGTGNCCHPSCRSVIGPPLHGQ